MGHTVPSDCPRNYVNCKDCYYFGTCSCDIAEEFDIKEEYLLSEKERFDEWCVGCVCGDGCDCNRSYPYHITRCDKFYPKTEGEPTD